MSVVEPPSPPRRVHPPIATVLVTLATAAGAAAQLADPGLVDRFRRDYPALHDGEWWRWFTPLLVQPAGWGQIAFNIASLVVAGVIAERRFGTVRWLLLYLGTGLFGEGVVGERLDPHGAGNSIAVCGLVGGLAALLLLRPGEATRPHAFVVPYYTACVAGLGFGGTVGAFVAPTAVLVVLSILLRNRHYRGVAFGAAVVSLVTAGLLAARPDQHGIGLAVGAGLGLLLAATVRPGPRVAAPARTSSR
ncbi:rhomboid family intramembrane serine protease [Dactylosporangium matsuzakiense]|uniref:rhomboid family intramembrane serine protease n=1 Tax=Dactylosporangium matsuzakiense TaxID=53360 RepID=UPI0021C43948|nr:rhomboid family intramembrane serine protease [Dactylosporangium matsuzakiense]UWZ41191.1 rhomboid family intramembrane serine protease [Dactylosporangium matsuzakiense]